MRRLIGLETFVAVARAGTITRAAERLGVSKSVASERLAALEAQLGVALIARTTRASTLTEAGERLLVRAEAILGDIDEAVAEVAQGTARLAGRLRVAAPQSFGLTVLRDVVTGFARDHPDVALELDLSDREADLVEDGFDLALRIGKLPDSSMIARRLTRIHHVVVAAPAFWRAHGVPQTPDALAALPCMAYARGGRPRPLRWTAPDGSTGEAEPRPSLVTTSGFMMAAGAEAGLGFAVLPGFLAQDGLDRGALEAVLTDHAWSDVALHVVYPPTRRPTARARAFEAAVTTHLREASAG